MSIYQLQNIMNNFLSIKIIKYILEFLDKDLKLLVCKVGSTNEERNKILSIELIMKSGLEEHFKEILLSNRLSFINDFLNHTETKDNRPYNIKSYEEIHLTQCCNHDGHCSFQAAQTQRQ